MPAQRPSATATTPMNPADLKRISCVVTVALAELRNGSIPEERFLDWGIIWMCQPAQRHTSRDQALCGLSFPRLGPFHLASSIIRRRLVHTEIKGQETQVLPKKATGDTRTKIPSRMCRACNSFCVPFSGTGFWTPQFCPNMGCLKAPGLSSRFSF